MFNIIIHNTTVYVIIIHNFNITVYIIIIHNIDITVYIIIIHNINIYNNTILYNIQYTQYYNMCTTYALIHNINI